MRHCSGRNKSRFKPCNVQQNRAGFKDRYRLSIGKLVNNCGNFGIRIDRPQFRNRRPTPAQVDLVKAVSDPSSSRAIGTLMPLGVGLVNTSIMGCDPL